MGKAARSRKAKKSRAKSKSRRPLWRRVLRWVRLTVAGGALAVLGLVLVLRFVNPPINFYQAYEWVRVGSIKRDWVPMRQISRHAALSAAAAEDANFCRHYGFDLDAIQAALDGGARRGGSTISQQTAKNVFLWQGRSWVRKGLEAGFTGLIEGLWGKRRIMEVYLNIAEFDEGVFGVEAASQHYFGVSAADLSAAQAARLMAILPDPKDRSASRPGSFTQRRARQIVSGAGTIATDGRAGCFLYG